MPRLATAAEPSYSGLEEEANPSCPAASQIGTSVTGAGAGTHPVYLPGKVYLAGPYKGAPLSLAVITPAISGPYDLGNVVVRVALHVNPETAQITAVSDPLPQILEGIPLRLRSIRSTSTATTSPSTRQTATPSRSTPRSAATKAPRRTSPPPSRSPTAPPSPSPPSSLPRLTGSTKQAGNPSLHTVLTYPQGGAYANIARTSVTLPHTEFLDSAHLKNPCPKRTLHRRRLSAKSARPPPIYGYAKAETPLLEKPLEGPVYLRTAPGRHYPDIVAALNGQIDIALVGHVESVPGKLRTTFETVPDAPVSRFTLTLDGGNKGLLENSPNLCASTQHVSVQMTGQNGKTANQNPVLQTPCGKKHKRKGHKDT